MSKSLNTPSEIGCGDNEGFSMRGIVLLPIAAVVSTVGYEVYQHSPLSISLLGTQQERYHTMMVEEGYALPEETMTALRHQRCGEPYTVLLDNAKTLDYSLEDGITITVIVGNEKTIFNDLEGDGLVDTYQRVSVSGRELEYLRPQSIPYLAYQSGEALEQNAAFQKSHDIQLLYQTLLAESIRDGYQTCEHSPPK